MRSMWRGAISFGLVMIPVKLYAATEQKDIAFRQVHRPDGGRIRFRRVCSIDGEEVPYEDVAKGYELPTGEMVVLTDEDMADLPLPSTRSIEVLHFMPAEELDPILLNRSYYAEPDPAGERAYVLLRDSLERSGKIALALVALRQRESLATLRAKDGVLVVETLLWPDEVREPDFAFLDEDIEARPQELQMAASLIDSMTTDFDPDAYHDNYREALQELVDAKVEGREVTQPAVPASEAEPTSLADALKASLAAARQAPAQSAGAMRAARAPLGIEGADGGDGKSRSNSGPGAARSGRARSKSADSGGETASRTGRARSKSAEAAGRTGRSPSKTADRDEETMTRGARGKGKSEAGESGTGRGRSKGEAGESGTGRGRSKGEAGESGTGRGRSKGEAGESGTGRGRSKSGGAAGPSKSPQSGRRRAG